MYVWLVEEATYPETAATIGAFSSLALAEAAMRREVQRRQTAVLTPVGAPESRSGRASRRWAAPVDGWTFTASESYCTLLNDDDEVMGYRASRYEVDPD